MRNADGGVVKSEGLAEIIHLVVPALPVHTPLSFVLLATAMSVAIGLAAGVLPRHGSTRWRLYGTSE